MELHAFQQWLSHPQAAREALLRDTVDYDLFSESQLEDHSEENGQNFKNSPELLQWAFDKDDEEIIGTLIEEYCNELRTYLLPVYEITHSWDQVIETGELYLARTARNIITVVRTDWEKRSGREFDIEFHELDNFELAHVVEDFVERSEEELTCFEGYPIVSDKLEEYEEEGRLNGKLEYASSIPWLPAKRTGFILV